MTQDLKRIRTTMEQLERLIRAVDDLKNTVLPNDPQLFAVMAEGPLEDLERLQLQIRDCVNNLEPIT